MPLVPYSTRADFDATYRVPMPDGTVAGFERRAFYPQYEYRSRTLTGRLNAAKAASILIVGCGFGWVVEALTAAGFTNVWGTDVSAYIQSAKAAQSGVPARVLPHDANTAAGRKAIQTDTGNRTWLYIITEDVLPALTDSEATGLATALRGMLAPTGVLTHVLTPAGPGIADARMNWKTVEQWRALLGLSDLILTVHDLDAAP